MITMYFVAGALFVYLLIIQTVNGRTKRKLREEIAGLRAEKEELTKYKLLYDELKNKLDDLSLKIEAERNLREKAEKETVALREKTSNLESRVKELENEKAKLNEEKSLLAEANSKLSVENQELKTKLEESEKAFEEKMELLKKSEDKLKETFENLANEILETTKEKMTRTSKENLAQILDPLKLQMKDFKEKIESLNKEEREKMAVLQKELKDLKELSIQLSTDAENLTKALKGESKTQGNWGELVLEKVLELSGLKEGREFDREVSMKNEENKRYRPDVIVHLPNERDVIIDAKTSLTAYSEYIATENDTYLKAHIQSIKRHIDELAEKNYEHLKGINTLDFIFMFVPIENALLVALEGDAGLFEYAFKKRIILVSPTTLLVSLRAIESSWRFERQAKNIEEVVKAAESLYDKVRGFTDDFEKIGKSLESAQKSFDNAKNKLTGGKGNVIRQVEILKQKAGIKPKKEISPELKDRALTGHEEENE